MSWHILEADLEKAFPAEVGPQPFERTFPLIFKVAGIVENMAVRSQRFSSRRICKGERFRQRFTERAVSHSVPTPWNRSAIAQNDVVTVAGKTGTWKVVAPVNGTKADLRRRESYDTRILTASVDNLTVVRRAGSPGGIF